MRCLLVYGPQQGSFMCKPHVIRTEEEDGLIYVSVASPGTTMARVPKHVERMKEED